MSHGILITFEGLDGVGKTTQVARTQAWLTAQGYRVKVVREPGGTPWGEAIRTVLLHHDLPRHATAEFLLFAAARAELVPTVLAPWLNQGGILLADRYLDSSVAYQGYGGGGDLALIQAVNAAITAPAPPQCTFWLDGPAHVSADPDDLIESRPSAFFDRVRQGYQALANQHPGRIVRLDASASPDSVFAAICTALSTRLPPISPP